MSKGLILASILSLSFFKMYFFICRSLRTGPVLVMLEIEDPVYAYEIAAARHLSNVLHPQAIINQPLPSIQTCSFFFTSTWCVYIATKGMRLVWPAYLNASAREVQHPSPHNSSKWQSPRGSKCRRRVHRRRKERKGGRGVHWNERLVGCILVKSISTITWICTRCLLNQ